MDSYFFIFVLGCSSFFCLIIIDSMKCCIKKDFPIPEYPDKRTTLGGFEVSVAVVCVLRNDSPDKN